MQGAIDFQRAVPAADGVTYPRYGRPGFWVAIPGALTLARRPDGTPDFQLDLVRDRLASDTARAGYGIVDCRLAPAVDLVAARRATGGDVVDGAVGHGWLRMICSDPGASERTLLLLPPMRVTSSGVGTMRLVGRVTPLGASLLKQALLRGTVLVEAWAEMEIGGVAPRHPLTVSIDASRLRAALASRMREGLVARASVVAALSAPDVIGPLPEGLDRLDVAEAVADRLRTSCATHVPAPLDDMTEWWNLDLRAGDTRLHWDLTIPTEAVRIHTVRFNPLDALRTSDGDAAAGLASSIVERDLPELDTGFERVVVSANLPPVRSRLLGCGAEMSMKAAPPHRMHAIRETVEFQAPVDRGELALRLVPGESRACAVATFAFLETSSGVHEYRAPSLAHPGGDVSLGAADFAVRLVPVACTEQLVAAGSVTVTARWDGDSQSLALSPARREDTFTLPPQVTGVEYELSLAAGSSTVRARVPEADLRFLDRPLFREYGTQTVDVTVNFEDALQVIAVDFVPEGGEDADVVTLTFTPSRPSRTWTWFAASPFACGFRYRLFQSGTPRAWSAPQSAFAALRLTARELLQMVPS
jgi:hypothetical protein